METVQNLEPRITSHRHRHTHTGKCSETVTTINNHIFGYIDGYIQQDPKDQVQLWNKWSHFQVLVKTVHRADRSITDAGYAGMDDILNGMYELYTID